MEERVMAMARANTMAEDLLYFLITPFSTNMLRMVTVHEMHARVIA